MSVVSSECDEMLLDYWRADDKKEGHMKVEDLRYIHSSMDDLRLVLPCYCHKYKARGNNTGCNFVCSTVINGSIKLTRRVTGTKSLVIAEKAAHERVTTEVGNGIISALNVRCSLWYGVRTMSSRLDLQVGKQIPFSSNSLHQCPHFEPLDNISVAWDCSPVRSRHKHSMTVQVEVVFGEISLMNSSCVFHDGWAISNNLLRFGRTITRHE